MTVGQAFVRLVVVIEISVPARDYSYAPEIYLIFLFFPARKSIVTLQTVKIAGRRKNDMCDLAEGIEHGVRGRRSEVGRQRTDDRRQRRAE